MSAPARGRSKLRSPRLTSKNIRKAMISFTGYRVGVAGPKGILSVKG